MYCAILITVPFEALQLCGSELERKGGGAQTRIAAVACGFEQLAIA
jgi:hypothetical protein